MPDDQKPHPKSDEDPQPEEVAESSRELLPEELDQVAGGAGKVSFQDLHFVQKVNKSTP